MTQREFFEKVIANVNDTEMVDFAKSRIAQLDKDNERKKNTLNKTQRANEDLKYQIMDFLTSTPVTASKVAETFDISIAKSSSLLTQLVNSGLVVRTELKVEKKGKVNHYSVDR